MVGARAGWRRWALRAALCLGAAIPAAQAADKLPADKMPADTIPAARSVRIDTSASLTRLTFELSQSVVANAFMMAGPDRLILDLPEMEFQLDPAAGRGRAALARGRKDRRSVKTEPLGGLVSSFRFGQFAAGKSRIVIDLQGPAKLVRARSEAIAGTSGARLIIELAPSDRAAFTLAARQHKPDARAAPAAAAPAAAGSLPLVVLDPGHGGLDGGAHGTNGVQEKDVVYEFSRALEARLEATGRYRVLLTRSGDVFVPLSERVKIARAAGAALFMSVHADILGDEPGVSGATVYTVSEKASDAQAARVAEKENLADAAAGLDASDDQSDVSDILFDLTRRETRVYSHAFARTLVGYFKETGKVNKNPHRSAGFRVLKASDVPSVLLELGYLSSDSDLANLTSAEWRDKTAGSVALAIGQFFQTRQPGAAEAPLGLKRSLSAEEPEHVAARQR